jgi:polyferredoxin
MKERHRIGKVSAFAMYTVAIIVDLVGLILGFIGLNFIASVFGFVLFAIWFWLLGASFIRKPGQVTKQIAVMIFGAIPVIGALPIEQSVGVYINIRRVHKEDEVYNAKIRQQNITKQKEINSRIKRALWLREQRRFNNKTEEDDESGYSEAA